MSEIGYKFSGIAYLVGVPVLVTGLLVSSYVTIAVGGAILSSGWLAMAQTAIANMHKLSKK